MALRGWSRGMWSQKQEILQGLRAEGKGVVCADWWHCHTAAYRLRVVVAFRNGWVNMVRVGQSKLDELVTGSYSTLYCREHPEPHSIATAHIDSLEPYCASDIQLGIRLTDVPSPSCPLSRTSSTSRVAHRSPRALAATHDTRYSYACHDFTTCF